ncbi:metallopeptidase family protein [Patescibacteria group bacterium]
MNRSDFEKLVSEGIVALPKHIREKVDNAAVCVEDLPSSDQLRKTKIGPGRTLLGLYEGVPKTAWGRGFGGSLPDKITIFQRPIERQARTPERVKELVKEVVWHEIAHHFGFDEDGVRKMENKK